MEMLNVCRGFESNHCNVHAMDTDSREKLKEYISISPLRFIEKVLQRALRSVVQRIRFILSKILVYFCIISVYEKNGGSATGGFSKGGYGWFTGCFNRAPPRCENFLLTEAMNSVK